MERLAVLIALRDALDAQLGRNNGGTRTEADELMWDIYTTSGFDRTPLKVCGEKVGTMTISMSKAKPTITSDKLFTDWCISVGLPVQWYLDEDKIPAEDMERLRDEHPEWFGCTADGKWARFERLKPGPGGCVLDPETGEVVPGVMWHESQPVGTVVRGCKPSEVFDAMRRHGLDLGAIGGLLPSTSGGE